jgi:putative Mg2+ transporter-C (MgtC) family protein
MFLPINEQLELLVPVLVAMLLGGIIGFERELRDKPAGLRTHIFVAVSAALLVLVGPPLVRLYSDGFPMEIVRNEPLGILQAIIVGIGFIGGGIVIKDARSGNVANLTTAATLLFAGTVGVIVGARLYYLAAAVTILMLVLNLLFQMLETRVIQKHDS